MREFVFWLTFAWVVIELVRTPWSIKKAIEGRDPQPVLDAIMAGFQRFCLFLFITMFMLVHRP